MAKLIDTSAGYAPAHEIDNWDFPLHSEILPGLWVGGTDDMDTIEYSGNLHAPKEITKKEFDAVVTLYAWQIQLTGWLRNYALVFTIQT